MQKVTKMKPLNKELLQKIGLLEERVQELEQTSDKLNSHASLVQEVIEIFKELPIGRALINRAWNRVKLRYLTQVVLPRRYSQIEKIKSEAMPEEIKKLLTQNATNLYEKAEKDANHRLFFERKSSYKVQSIFERLQGMFNRRTPINHIKEGESHARNH